MEICNTIVVFQQKFPDLHSMIPVTVERPVYKLNLRNLSVQKKLKFFFHKVHISEPQSLIHGGKTITAVKGTASSGFVINDPVIEGFQILIWKWNIA
jgi:hypothetical protein